MWEQEARPKRNPYCSRCRNHGKSAQVKGHKRHCEYRFCQCEGCKLVMCRQIVSAAQIKRRRYQKQDEECGRRIEVSPPVLTKTANNNSSDPAALIAKTLIGSNKSCSMAALDSSGVGVGSSKLIDVGGTGAPPVAQATTRLQSQLQEHMMGLPAFQSASGNSFRDAQQLFQFTTAFIQQQQQHAITSNLLISAGANLGAAPIVPTSTTTLLTGSPVATGVREQLNLVEEIHRNFGPLAIFAWLRSEDFDVAKIRALIEMSRGSYEEMLQMNGHSALDLTSPIVDV